MGDRYFEPPKFPSRSAMIKLNYTQYGCNMKAEMLINVREQYHIFCTWQPIPDKWRSVLLHHHYFQTSIKRDKKIKLSVKWHVSFHRLRFIRTIPKIQIGFDTSSIQELRTSAHSKKTLPNKLIFSPLHRFPEESIKINFNQNIGWLEPN